MAGFKVSKKAQSDLRAIGHYTVKQWGTVQKSKYLRELDACFQKLAENPKLGRDISELRAGYYRYAHQSHVIFFVLIHDGIRIIRVLHNRMVPKRHL